MIARVIAAAVAVTLLVGVSAPPLGAQHPVAAPPVSEPTPRAPEPVPPPPSEPAPVAPAPDPVAATSPVPLAQERAAAVAAPAAPRPVTQQLAPGSKASHSTQTDVYDVAGGVVTALKAPFNVALCALGGVLGLAIFAGTLGSGYRAAARTVEEGCSGPWIVTGDDLRPERGRPATRWSDLHPAELGGR